MAKKKKSPKKSKDQSPRRKGSVEAHIEHERSRLQQVDAVLFVLAAATNYCEDYCGENINDLDLDPQMILSHFGQVLPLARRMIHDASEALDSANLQLDQPPLRADLSED